MGLFRFGTDMRITRRTSGGRGEYEISEQTADGLHPTDLLGRELVLQLAPDWQIPTGTRLTGQGGKRRIRRLAGSGIQLHRQIAAALLLPHPVRADAPLGRGAPVIREGQYAIENIELADVRLEQRTAVLAVREIFLRNRTYQAEELHHARRIAELRALWERAESFPDSIAGLLVQHRNVATAGTTIPENAEAVVFDLQKTVSQTSADLGIVYYDGTTDVVRPLTDALARADVPPEPPVAVDAVDPDEIEIRRRTVREWKQWANARGSASARFRQTVRRAYDWTCIICGVHLPATRFNPVPGVDAAHILPWAEYELDHVSNGLCLCRLHHWAFDEALLVVHCRDGGYYAEVPEDVQQGIRAEVPNFSLNELLRYAGPIQEARLPRPRAQRPRPQFLELLNRAM